MAGKLTELSIRNAAPRAKKYKLADGGGLVLLVMPNGAKYWRFRYRWAGKQKELTVGLPYPTTSLSAARTSATKLRVKVAEGVDPAEIRFQAKLERQERAVHTVGAAANAWHEFRSKAWAPRTAAQVRMYLDKDLIPALGNRPLSHVTTKELASITRKIEERGAPDVAKKARQWLAAIFSYSRANGWTQVDPVRDLSAVVLPAGKAKNYAHLPLKDLPPLLKKLDEFPASPIVKGALMLSLWTANRPGVTRTLKWSEIDLDEAIWTIEQDRPGMKLGYRHLTPLQSQAVAMLREMHKLTGTFEHVFIGRNDPRMPISDGSVNALLKRLGYRGRQTTHGFRHLVSTALNELGYEPDWVERQLAHGDPDKIRGTYNKAQYLDSRRTMMQAWADHIDELRIGASKEPR